MLRPLYLDLLDVLLPLLGAIIAFACGRYLHRLAPVIFRAAIGLSVFAILVLAFSCFIRLPATIDEGFWRIGGVTTVTKILAMFLFGVVWSSHGRSTSNGFLRVMVGFVVLLVVLNCGGRLWWRTGGQATWRNAPGSEGRLTQTTGWTCSPAAATMLLNHYGVERTEGEMAYLANTSFLGTHPRSIAHALTQKGESRGLVAHVVQADYEACLTQTAPFLACVRIPRLGSHAVLVLRVQPNHIELIDPRFGRTEKIGRTEMESQWEGNIVEVSIAK